MIKVCILKENNLNVGFNVNGHAEFNEYGSDIICSAVSILVQTTIVSIDEILKEEYSIFEDEDNAIVDFKVKSPTDKTSLLIESMELGIDAIAKQYPTYVKITSEEVGL